MLKTTRRDVAKTSSTLRRAARERADNEARRVPWQKLLEARDHYLDWQEFYLWVRSILEVEHRVPAWLREVLDDRCPGFLEEEERGAERPTSKRPLHLCLEDWIEEQTFGFAKQEGWFNAIAYYSIRDPRYQSAEVCWAECVRKWKRAKPIRYPSFEEWKDMAAQCDSTAHLLAGERRLNSSSKRVNPGHLAETVSRYIDWEALAYWARPALESKSELPAEVFRELRKRCSGYLEEASSSREFMSRSQSWDRLMSWIADHFFEDAQKGGWFDAVLIQARSHPRAIRTMEYADHCDDIWQSRFPNPYPSFEEWRRSADAYVKTSAG